MLLSKRLTIFVLLPLLFVAFLLPAEAQRSRKKSSKDKKKSTQRARTQRRSAPRPKARAQRSSRPQRSQARAQRSSRPQRSQARAQRSSRPQRSQARAQSQRRQSQHSSQVREQLKSRQPSRSQARAQSQSRQPSRSQARAQSQSRQPSRSQARAQSQSRQPSRSQARAQSQSRQPSRGQARAQSQNRQPNRSQARVRNSRRQPNQNQARVRNSRRRPSQNQARVQRPGRQRNSNFAGRAERGSLSLRRQNRARASRNARIRSNRRQSFRTNSRPIFRSNRRRSRSFWRRGFASLFFSRYRPWSYCNYNYRRFYRRGYNGCAIPFLSLGFFASRPYSYYDYAAVNYNQPYVYGDEQDYRPAPQVSAEDLSRGGQSVLSTEEERMLTYVSSFVDENSKDGRFTILDAAYNDEAWDLELAQAPAVYEVSEGLYSVVAGFDGTLGKSSVPSNVGVEFFVRKNGEHYEVQDAWISSANGIVREKTFQSPVYPDVQTWRAGLFCPFSGEEMVAIPPSSDLPQRG